MEEQFTCFLANTSNTETATTSLYQFGTGVVITIGSSAITDSSANPINTQDVWMAEIVEYHNEENELLTWSESSIRNKLLRTGLFIHTGNWKKPEEFFVVLPNFVNSKLEFDVISCIKNVLQEHDISAEIVE